MDSMFTADGNQKGSSDNMSLALKDVVGSISYQKTNKLVTALYMVTDILDKDEPLRGRLRTLGLSIISDIHNHSSGAISTISELLSLISIAETMNLLSEMNAGILKQEFLTLKNAVSETFNKNFGSGEEVNLKEFLKDDPAQISPSGVLPKTQPSGIRLGVQKGGTLLKALSKAAVSDIKGHHQQKEYEVLKGQRRGDIINIIKLLGGGATIKDIKDKVASLPPNSSSLANCGDKTLQRELVAMVSAGVLDKVGEKRWSKYYVKK